jgi:F-type H+-transporting ATPase subunit b
MISSSLLVSSTPVVDVDGTVFVQAGIFLLLMLILRGLLFKPWLEARERRVEKIDGAIKAAEDLRTEADELGAHYDARLADAREKALEVRSDARRKSDADGSELVGAARKEAGERLDQARAKLDGEIASARSALSSRVDALSKEIATKVLGRSA